MTKKYMIKRIEKNGYKFYGLIAGGYIAKKKNSLPYYYGTSVTAIYKKIFK
jgi:hypothetical protein